MYLRRLCLVNFRNQEKFQAEFDRTNIILGANATGKTSIIEAIYLLSTSKSFRTKESEDLIFFLHPFAKAIGDIEEDERKFNLEIILKRDQGSKKRLKINGKPRRIISMLGLFQTVLFTPETLSIVSGSPSMRRRSLDILLSSISRKYAATLLSFLKIIRQRNRLLFKIKESNKGVATLDVFDPSFISTSEYLQKTREIFLKQINGFLPEKLQIEYLPSPRHDLKKILKENRQKEMEFGFSLFGPQKDDFIFLFKDRPLSLFGSRGEIREGAILFKLAEWEFIRKTTGFLPVLLLDDMFSELDRSKRAKIEELLKQGQTILTSTSLSYLSPKIISKSKVIELK